MWPLLRLPLRRHYIPDKRTIAISLIFSLRGDNMKAITVRPLIYAGTLLLALGIVSGILTHPYGFPWGSVIAIAAGTWCLLTAIKSWIESKDS